MRTFIFGPLWVKTTNRVIRGNTVTYSASGIAEFDMIVRSIVVLDEWNRFVMEIPFKGTYVKNQPWRFEVSEDAKVPDDSGSS